MSSALRRIVRGAPRCAAHGAGSLVYDYCVGRPGLSTNYAALPHGARVRIRMADAAATAMANGRALLL